MTQPDIKFQTEVVDHIEQLTLEMRTSFQAVNARLDDIKKTQEYHREILLNHGEMLRLLLQQKSGE